MLNFQPFHSTSIPKTAMGDVLKPMADGKASSIVGGHLFVQTQAGNSHQLVVNAPFAPVDAEACPSGFVSINGYCVAGDRTLP